MGMHAFVYLVEEEILHCTHILGIGSAFMIKKNKQFLSTWQLLWCDLRLAKSTSEIIIFSFDIDGMPPYMKVLFSIAFQFYCSD